MAIVNFLPIKTILRGNSYHYCIEKVLGQGSFGITYLAKVRLEGSLGELQSDITVAVKEFFMRDFNARSGTNVLTESNSELYHNYRKDFMREANNLARLKHPHIVKVLEAFEGNNTAYFSMEFIEGGNLNDYIQSNGVVSEQEALKGISQIGEALSLMHSNKMLHLDLKPLNIMRRKNGELVLIDFGLSKQFNSNGEPESSTRIGAGTMGYAPLEQSNYKKEDGFPPTLDIYALGATLFKSLTGIPPYDASTIFNDGFPENEMRKMGISDELIMLTSWAMEPMKRKRPQTVDEYLLEVNRILPSVSNKQPPSTEITVSLQSNMICLKVYEECNGFHVNWAENLSEHKKTQIRNLLMNMKKIGYKEQIAYTEYGTEVVGTFPLMSLQDFTRNYLYRLVIGENTDGYFPPHTTRLLLNIVQQLEAWTALPFRLATEEELRYECSACEEHWKQLRTLCYSPDSGFQYRTHWTNDCIHELTDNAWDEIFDIQLVCVGLTPVYRDSFFNIPCTQVPFDEIQPIGMSLYKVRKGTTWNITSPESPLSSYLPEDYDSISTIGIWHIPEGGPESGYDFLGIKAVKWNVISYYSFNKNIFKLIASLSPEDIRDREMWT